MPKNDLIDNFLVLSMIWLSRKSNAKDQFVCPWFGIEWIFWDSTVI